MTKVSIILPVYNVANYLPKCLDSLLNQTLEDIEIICVDDSSSDNSLQVLQNYAAKDKRIKVLNQPNSGPGVARNQGIKEAKGEYIGFVDPDDWVDENMFEKMYSAAKANDADLVECGLLSHSEKTGASKMKIKLPSVIPQRVFNWRDNPQYIFDIFSPAWNKLCRSSLLHENNILFSPGRYAEDHIFTVSVRLLARKAYFINEPLYHYLLRKKSLTRTFSAGNKEVPIFVHHIEKFLREKGVYDELKDYFVNDAASLCAAHYNKTSFDARKEYRRICQEKLPPEAYDIFTDYINENTFWRRIFSIKYKWKGGQKYLMICIFGLKLKLKGK